MEIQTSNAIELGVCIDADWDISIIPPKGIGQTKGYKIFFNKFDLDYNLVECWASCDVAVDGYSELEQIF